jgi:hypothetical protein
VFSVAAVVLFLRDVRPTIACSLAWLTAGMAPALLGNPDPGSRHYCRPEHPP